MTSKRTLRSSKMSEKDVLSNLDLSDVSSDGEVVELTKKVPRMDLVMSTTKHQKLPFGGSEMYHENESFDVLKLCVIKIPKLCLDSLEIRKFS